MLLRLSGVLNPQELADLRAVLEKGELESGISTASGSAARVKKNLQLAENDESVEQARKTLVGALNRHPIFRAAAQPSRLTPPRFSRYDPGMRYGDHLDSPLMGRPGDLLRLDISVTMFLADRSEYDGGELVIDTDYGIESVKLDAGSCVLYPSDKFHRVEEVTRGSRLVAVLWVQSLVSDPARRKLLLDLAGAVEYLDRFGKPDGQLEVLRRCHANLLRMWSRP
jgi:PKHD-type hydroxylase